MVLLQKGRSIAGQLLTCCVDEKPGCNCGTIACSMWNICGTIHLVTEPTVMTEAKELTGNEKVGVDGKGHSLRSWAGTLRSRYARPGLLATLAAREIGRWDKKRWALSCL